MESTTKTIAKRARVEPRTQMHLTMKMSFLNVFLEKMLGNYDNKFKLCIEALDRANKSEK